MKPFYFTIIIISCCLASCKNKPLFTQVTSSESGISFNNKIIENDSINPFDLTNIYNGGGVGIGDFNNDGLQDIYFTGNVVSNKLYINKGHLKFEDITDQANVSGEGKWSRGVSVVDINGDGKMDIYISATIKSSPEQRRNILYINQGNDKNGVPRFKDMAAEYGLDDTTFSTMATFFDYDNDGDLDMYLTVNQIKSEPNPNAFRPIVKDGSFFSTGRLYRNDWDSSLNHPVFKNVSKEAGITIEGYGHSATIADIDQDGWKDIYVSNDFVGNDILYINNHDGTFTDQVTKYFKHTSQNGMGQDIIDINNDGLADVIELDMNPEDNYRKKTMMNGNNYQMYYNSDHFGYQYQYVRNSLQLNQGRQVGSNDTLGHPVFSDISFLAGIAETDWSWTPLIADFDNDGYRDIIVTNGYPKDVTDHDFIFFRQNSSMVAPKDFLLKQIPEVKLASYAFHNNGNLTFKNVSEEWGIKTPSFSNGAAYVDLDNDGDLDYVVNRINDEAAVYENNSNTIADHGHYLKIKFSGKAPNLNGVGASVELNYSKGKKQVFENNPYRGYLSTDELGAHFGLGNTSVIDSVIVKWPDGKMQLLLQVKADQELVVKHDDAHLDFNWQQPVVAKNTLFKEISDSIGAALMHKESDYIDFDIQKLLPHKLSDYGPALAVGDVNGDGIEDLISGGSVGYSAQILLQDADGKFSTKNLIPDANPTNKPYYDMGIVLFDADGDGDLDLYIASGGNQSPHNTTSYQDQFFLNDGKGNFTKDTSAFPINNISKSCVRAVDYDNDGDLDLFVSGRVNSGKYPQPVSSFIYRNDSKNGVVKFTDVTATVAKDLINIGMTCDALFTDFDNDGWPDMIIAGEFMPIKFFKNNHGKFDLLQTDLDNKSGWWNSIIAGDFDNDGDVDYIVGNLGLNSFYRGSDQYPVRAYGKDFDNDGNYDALFSLYLPTSQLDTIRREYPAHTKDDETKQIVEIRKRFPRYKDYAVATMDNILSDERRKGAVILSANYFQTSFIRNDGNGQFTIQPLPIQAQFSSIYGMIAEDVDGDGNLDIVMTGNDYGTEVSVGRYDALNGLVLKGDGKGNFKSLSIEQSGIYIPGNGKALVKIANSKGNCLIAASQNRDAMKVFELKKQQHIIPLQSNDSYATLTLKNGKKRKTEFNYGAGFISQSGRFLNIDNNVTSVEITDSKGKSRNVSLQ